jgi:hypothetical protein
MNMIPPSAELRSTLIGICVVMGIGMLIGAERERRKDNSSTRSAAGIGHLAWIFVGQVVPDLKPV